MAIDSRHAALLARCSEFAREKFEPLQGHYLLPAILDILEAIPGRLYSIDIERAFMEAKGRAEADKRAEAALSHTRPDTAAPDPR